MPTGPAERDEDDVSRYYAVGRFRRLPGDINFCRRHGDIQIAYSSWGWSRNMGEHNCKMGNDFQNDFCSSGLIVNPVIRPPRY